MRRRQLSAAPQPTPGKEGGIAKRGRLPNQHSLRDIFLRAGAEAKASKGRGIPSRAEVEAEKVAPPPTASAKWVEYLARDAPVRSERARRPSSSSNRSCAPTFTSN
jgi:hypothetical protein